MRNLFVLGALAAAISAPAMAQEVSVSGNVTLTTDYMWRNVSQTAKDWAIQGGFDIDLGGGAYAGTWASSLANSSASIELDIYGGYAFEAAGMGFDVGFIYYAYPDAGADIDFYEVYGGVSKEFGAVGLGGMLSWDPDNETVYLDLSGSYALTDAFSVSAGYGSYVTDNGYAGWNVGASYSFAGLDFGMTYYDNDIGSDQNNILFSIGKAM